MESKNSNELLFTTLSTLYAHTSTIRFASVQPSNHLFDLTTQINADFTSVSAIDNVTNTSSDGIDTEKKYDEYIEYIVAFFIQQKGLYLLTPLGLFGSIASLVTLSRMKLFFTSAMYMAALAIVDGISLVIKLTFVEIKRSQISIGGTACALFYYNGTWTQQYSNWILVAMTFERFIAIRFPLKVSKFCTKRNTFAVLLIILFTIMILNCHFLWTFHEVPHPLFKYECMPRPEYETFLAKKWYWIDGVSYAMLPCLLLLICNGCIIHKIRASTGKQLDLTNNMHINAGDKNKQQKQVTIMLLSLSIVFTILTLPNCIFFIVKDEIQINSNYKVARFYLIYNVIYFLSDINQSINFYLYCVAGRKFRQKFIEVFTCKENRRHHLSRLYVANDMGRRTSSPVSTCAGTGVTRASSSPASDHPSIKF
ncbi:hypothetical protein ACJMK2_022090 [Sinanodonta woodiana]|uniref:G-protein coupled receptors family 1 profile domain-containing protein n=1 Tax=Sinanodonta woodiana TaxID=1069815 RepID=A0ABD3TJZ9_SINWO